MTTENEIIEVAKKLYFLKVFTNSPMWVNYQMKKRTNPKAILYTMQECLAKKPTNPWAYCEIVVRKSGPKFNARDFEAKAQEDRNGFIALVDALKELMEKKKPKSKKDFYEEEIPF